MAKDDTMRVDPALDNFSGKTRKMVAVVDSLGYTDKKGFPRYVDRGAEVELPVEEIERLTGHDARAGLFPAVVEPDHPKLGALVQGFTAQEDPGFALMKLRDAHDASTVALDPAGDDATRERTGPDPGDDKGPWNIPALGGAGLGFDLNELDQKSLSKIAKAAGIEPKSQKKADLVEALEARYAVSTGADAGITPRLGATTETETADSE